MTSDTGDDRSEGQPHDHEVDRQFGLLLEGLRTSIPGVQVLFAFLLTVPLQRGVDDLQRAELISFSIAFYSAAIASILLIAPSAHQRLRAPDTGLRRHSRRHLIQTTWMTIVGTLAMGLAICSTVFFVAHLAFALHTAAIATALISVMTGWAWVYLPVVSFRAEQSPD